MKKISMIRFGVVGILALSLGLSDVLAKGQPNVSDGNKYKVVTVEKQEVLENKTFEEKNLRTVITADEQNRVENSSALFGFVSQENGQGFYFIKEK